MKIEPEGDRNVLSHDLHTHTTYSDGRGEPLQNIEAAERRGLSFLGISDHVQCLTGRSQGRYLTELMELRKEADLTLLIGVEANAMPGGSDVPGEMRKKLDYVISSVHNVVDSPEEYLSLVRDSLTDEKVDIIGHFGISFPNVGWPSWEELVELIKLAEENGKAFEISSWYRVPELDFIKECVRRGVQLSFGSDAHRPDRVGDVSWSVKMFRKAGGKEEDLFISRFV
ncbi:MAG: PHP domain-containing protein [Thermococci archaeon]|nr:PHP domain-containing protein [Thermococci archaeon]